MATYAAKSLSGRLVRRVTVPPSNGHDDSLSYSFMQHLLLRGARFDLNSENVVFQYTFLIGNIIQVLNLKNVNKSCNDVMTIIFI